MAKTERNVEIARLYEGGLTMAQVGDRYGLSRERIRQILAKLNIEGRHPRPYLCLDCGGKTESLRRLCQKCQHRRAHPVFECAVCGKVFPRRMAEVRRRQKRGQRPPTYCTHKCYGHMLGKLYGTKSSGPCREAMKLYWQDPANIEKQRERRCLQWASLSPEQQQAHMALMRAGQRRK